MKCSCDIHHDGMIRSMQSIWLCPTHS